MTILEKGTYYYDVVIGTGVWKDSGTTASVTIGIKGETDELNLIPLRSKEDTTDIFSRGSIDGFALVTNESLGPLKEVTLEHDNTGENPSWFIETVSIRDRQTKEQWVFALNRWLAVERDDGQIDVTVESRRSLSFSDEVRLLFGRQITDNHLWVSTIGKAPSSTFTRVQRASCCLSLLFSSMIANAMFYNIGGESEGAIHVGPFKFSWRQIVIGVQSGLIVAPVNILIVLLFKSSRPRTERREKYTEMDEAQQLVDDIKNPGCMLPHFCVYFAWFLCFVTTLTATAFTLFYSLMWGKEVAQQWLASILISSVQDILVVQPTKVMLVVVMIVLLFKKPKDRVEDPGIQTDACSTHENDRYFQSDDPKQRLKRARLQAIRERTKKEIKLAGMVKEIVLHLIFMFFLAVVCYGNKNDYRFLMTSEMITPFETFDKVRMITKSIINFSPAPTNVNYSFT